ncbi:hypothetical protein NBRC116594_07050 [Shimia sp. NS0008-38b]|uniref:hypothetical protein n=1 Tax=Shimia sp. NS0008-38b TaxID=3127653 RepID=UPI003106EF43
MHRFVLHLPPHQLEKPSVRSTGFYGNLANELRQRGAEVVFRERAYLRAHPDLESDAFHFVHQGLVQMPNALNTGPSYLRDFWYADPKGVFGMSSLFDLQFEVGNVPPERAASFADWLRRRIVNKRLSKHLQPNAANTFAPGAIAVFLQGESLPTKRVAFTDEARMVEALISVRAGREVLIKRHPRNSADTCFPEIAAMADANDGVRIVDANIHDMLVQAAVCASISSSVAVEAMLHNVPSLTFGRVDFHHCTQTVERIDDVPEALEVALTRAWPYEAFLFWFFRQHCLDMRAKKWFATLNRRLGDFAFT